MSTIPENVLDEVGRQLTGLEAERAESPPEADTPLVGNLGALLKRYTELENERRKHEADEASLKDQIKPLEDALLEAFAEAGIQNARANGLTVFIRTDRYVNKKTEVATDTICETLTKLGMGYMVKAGYSASSLKAKVGEWRAEGIEVPAELAALIKVGEVERITSRK